MKTKIKHFSKRSLSLILTLMMLLSSIASAALFDAIAATIADDSAVGTYANSGYIYVVPGKCSIFNSYVNSNTGKLNSTCTLKCNYQYWNPSLGTNGEDDWSTTDFSIIGRTYQGKAIYRASITTTYGAKTVQIQVFDNGDWKDENEVNSNEAAMANRLYTGNNTYVDYTSTTFDTVYLSGYLGKKGTNSYETGEKSTDYTFTYNSTNDNYTLSYIVNGDQYAVVNAANGSTAYIAYHPSTPNSDSGVAAGTFDTNYQSDPKWKITASSGDNVALTWDAKTYTLSWTVTAASYTVTRSVTGSSYGTLKLNGSASNVTGLSGTNSIAIVATPNSNCRLKSLKVGDTEKLSKAQSTAYSSSVSVSEATTITATFEQMPTYYLLGEKLNSWGTSYALTSTDGDTFTYTFDGTNATFPAGKFLVSSSESTSNNVKADAATSGNTGVTLSKDVDDLTFTYTSGYGCPVTVTYYESTGYNGTVKLVASQENFTGLSINAKGTDDGTNYNVTVSPSTLTLSASSGNSSTGVTATASTTADNYKLTGFTATNGTVSNVNLTAGTCTFKPSANNASVTAKYGKVYTVSTSSNNTALGTVSASPTSAAVGSTVTVTCTDVSGTFSSAVVKQGTTTVKSSTLKEFSFTMPAGNVNITATFTEYIGDSDYYYDGFGSNGGAVLSGFSNVQLNEGKINGSAYGYYSPSSAGRSGNDQLFLIKKKNSSGGTSTTRYVYFTRNKEIYDWYHYDTLYAYFYDDNGVVGNAWPGSGKSSYTTNSQGEKIFRFALPTSYSGTLKVVFNNGVGKKTSDITLNSGGYYVVDGTTSGDVYTNIGTWSPDSTNYPNAGLGSGSGSDDYTIFYNVENGNSNSAIYKSDSSYGATLNIYDHGANDAGGTYRRFSKVSTTSDYYIIVFYPGNTYTFDDKTFTVPSGNDPIVIASDTLPGVVSNSVTIYAKDGSIRSGYQKFADMADTKITGTDVTTTSYPYYEKAKVDKGSSVTITTTIDSGMRDKYYVRGFCVNGQTYGPTTKAEALASHTNGVYSFTLNIPSAETFADKFGDVNALEITPVYFYLDSREVTTFYVKGYEGDVVKKWGNTLACYVYYSSGVESYSSTDDSLQNAFGGYPGQPMIFTGGRYMIEVPTYIDSGSKRVKGVTLNNYYYDDIHKSLGFATENLQTYDYDDFNRIRTLNDYKDIVFTFKYKKTIDNPNTGDIDTTKSYTTKFKGESYYTNGFEYLYNAQGKKIDLFGNVIPSTSTASPVYVVSNGYENYNTTVGAYATSWSIFPSGAASDTERTAVMTPSVRFAADADSVASFYNNNTQGTKFKTAYNAVNNSDYLNHPVLITYEKALLNDDSNTTPGGGDKAERCDGVWSYTKASDYISSNIKIEYGSSATGTFTTDTFTDTHVGTVTGCEAYFTNEAFYGAVTSPSQYADASSNYELYADADSAGRYMFLGWYLLSEGVYTKLDDWFVSETTSPMATSDTYVARFITTPTGSVRFTHDLFKNAPTLTHMPTVHTGTGKTYIKVDVIDPDRDDAVVATYGNTTSAESANVPATYITATSTYKLRVTLTTIPTGLNTLTAMYENDETHNEYISITPSGTTGTITTTREIDIVNMFDNNLDLLYNNVEYYSDITPVTKNYKITFNYTDRFGDTKSYIKKGTLTESFVASHNDGTQASIYIDKAFIMSLAPYEDNFSEVIRWNDSAISDGKITSSGTSDITYTVASVQTTQTVNLKYNSSCLTDGPLDISKDYTYGSLVLKDGSTTEFSLKAPDTNPNNANEKFSYWEIKTTDGKLVAKNYSVYFNYRLYDDYVIRPVYSTNPEKYNTANVSTTIQFLEYSRNQWTDANGVSSPSTDKLFADFAVAFNKNGELINPSSNNCGIIFAIGDTSVYDEGNINTNLTGVSFTTNEDSLKAYIKSGSTYTQGSSDTKTVKKLSINSLDNKNRVEVYSAFKNQTSNTYPVIKVYSYIVDGSNVYLSDPIFINLYDTSVATYK